MLLVSALLGALAIELTAISPAESPVPSSHSTLSAGPQASSTNSPSSGSPSSATEKFAWPPAAKARVWKSIVVHHSATAGGSVAAIDAVHRGQRDAQGNPWLGIGYHFVIGNGSGMNDGEVQATFRWRDQLAGAHAGEKNYNESGIGICLIGNFDEAAPTARQSAAVAELVRSLAREYDLEARHIVRHQDFQATRCPGRLFPWQQMLAAVTTARPKTTSVVR